MSKKRIAIIIPYFGELPSHFNLFLKSCSKNKDIDFLLFTDDERVFNYPENVKKHIMRFNDLNDIINTKLNINIKIKRPYKLCDFRPSYGKIFENYLGEYEFWGFCDIDLIFGDISKFITHDITEQYNKILINGHFQIYRNINEVNNYYLLNNSKISFEKVANSNKNHQFDEMGGIYDILKENGIPQYFNNRIFADIYPKSKKLIDNRFLNNYYRQAYLWENGRLFHLKIKLFNKVEKREILYLHFQKRKLDIKFSNENNVEKFYITENGFVEDIDLSNKKNISISKELIKLFLVKVKIIK